MIFRIVKENENVWRKLIARQFIVNKADYFKKMNKQTVTHYEQRDKMVTVHVIITG